MRILYAFLTLALSIPILQKNLMAQEVPDLPASESVYIQVDYMKPLPGKADAYVNLERELWKPIHNARIQAREILGWYLFELQYPRGTAQNYDFVTVTIFSNFLDADEVSVPFEEIVMKVHPDMDPAKLEARTEETRKLVKSEVWKSLYQLLPGSSTPPKAVLVDYMAVKPEKEEAYLRLEREVWKPVHQLRLEEGYIHNWTLYGLEFPDEEGYPYSHATATVFDDWSKIMDSWPEEGFRQVHDDGEEEALVKLTFETRDLVSSEIWNLVDFVVASQE